MNNKAIVIGIISVLVLVVIFMVWNGKKKAKKIADASASATGNGDANGDTLAEDTGSTINGDDDPLNSEAVSRR